MQIAAMPRLPPVRSSTFEHVQHDARARRADRMADRDRAAVDVEPVLVERAHRARQAELVAAIVVVSPTRAGSAITCAANASLISHASRSFEAEAVASRGSASPRARARGPSAPDRAPPSASRRCGRAASSLCSSTARSDASSDPRGAVGDLRAVAGGHVAVLAVEERLELREILRRRILAHAVVGRVERARFVVERHDLAVEMPGASARRARAGGCAPRNASISLARDAEADTRGSPRSGPSAGRRSDRSVPSSARSPARGTQAGTAPRSAARWPSVFAAYQFDSHSTIASENSSGARDSASTPPASTRLRAAGADVR